MAKLLQAPTKNAVQKTLASQLLSTSSTGDAITFSDVDGIANAPGVLVIDRVDSNGDSTPSSREYIEYSGTSGNTVIITTRNVDGSNAAITHQVGAIVEFIPDVTWAGRIHTALSNVVDATDLSLDTTKVTDLTTAQTLTNKTLTSPVLNTGVSGTAVLDEDDMASDSATQLATQQSIKAYVNANAGNSDGWIDATTDTWTYASASTFTISGVDRTAQLQKGTKIKFTQTTVKYAVVTNVSFSTNTTVTIAVNDDYTIANAAISANYYSYQDLPQGYPEWFNFTTTWGGFSVAPTGTFRFAIKGKLCVVEYKDGASGTSNSTSLNFTVPVATKTSQSNLSTIAVADNGSNLSTPGHFQSGVGSATIAAYKSWYHGAWTSSGSKQIFPGTFSFEWN